MKRQVIWCIATILAVLLLFAVTLRVFALSPMQTTPLPPLNEIPYSDGELNMIANAVNGEVGGITGSVTLTYADGTTVEADACLLHMIHARVVDNQARHDMFPDSVRSCLNLYWTSAYTATGWRSSAQWQHCRQDVLWALYGFVDLPDNVLAATCDPYFADKYVGYRLWARVRWDTGWTHGTFYYYQYGGN